LDLGLIGRDVAARAMRRIYRYAGHPLYPWQGSVKNALPHLSPEVGTPSRFSDDA